MVLLRLCPVFAISKREIMFISILTQALRGEDPFVFLLFCSTVHFWDNCSQLSDEIAFSDKPSELPWVVVGAEVAGPGWWIQMRLLTQFWQFSVLWQKPLMGLGGQSLLKSAKASACALCTGSVLITETKVGWCNQLPLPDLPLLLANRADFMHAQTKIFKSDLQCVATKSKGVCLQGCMYCCSLVPELCWQGCSGLANRASTPE